MEIRSPLRYPGGKFKAMPQIMPHIPANVKDWREPFFGGGSVTLYYLQRCLEGMPHEITGEIRQVPKTITVGDFNPEIWAFWTGCRDCAYEAVMESFNIICDFNSLYYKQFDDLKLRIDNTSSDVYTRFNEEMSGKLEAMCNSKVTEIKSALVDIYDNYGVNTDVYGYEELYKVCAKSRGDADIIKGELDSLGIQGESAVKMTEDICSEMFTHAKEKFEEYKNMNKEDKSLAWRCARQFIINRISFSGMGDAGTLSKDQFMDFRMSDALKLVEVSPLLKNIDIKNVSFEEIMRLEPMGGATKDEVYIFLDPPYLTQESSGLYGKNGEMHLGFPHQLFVDECKRSPYKFLVTYDDSTQVRRMFKGLVLKPFRLTYTMAGKTSDDALAGEELFIANFNLDEDKISGGSEFDDGFGLM